MALLKRKVVLARTTLGVELLHRLIEEGKFPKPIRIIPHRVAWIEAEVDEREEQRRKERDEAA